MKKPRPEDVAAVLMEPVLGEGGFIPAPIEYVKALRRFCDEHGILLIVDEACSVETAEQESTLRQNTGQEAMLLRIL